METLGQVRQASLPNVPLPGGPSLRILQILEATLGGTARHVLDLCGGLCKEGHDVHLVYNPRPGRMDEIFGRGLPRLVEAGVVAVPMDMPRSVGVGDAYARVAGVGLPGLRLYTPNAFITTNPRLGSASRLAYGLMESLLGRLGHGLIAVSQEEFDHALALGLQRRKLALVPNGTDVSAGKDSGQVRRELALPEDVLLIGYVGRMVPQKDPENVLRAFAAVAAHIDRARLAMVGDGPLMTSSRKAADALGIGARIHWLGVQDGPSVMPAFDLFALSSLYEGFPYVLIEAMARGLPIVTTEVGGARTLIEDGKNGFIVPTGRPDRLADALAKLASDAELRKRMGERSRERASLFSAGRMVQGNLEAYRCVLEEEERRRPGLA
jgi:glycosyltransferase involved in cell wall biosynthesis